ncbi:hypothetical protein ACFTWH_18005 [Streptomyces sp. NPDC057011]|uniref:hypothetical protein n=1 Tax=unclassified Streptomyces TaxID=2593676 RepID=UPI003633CF6F
MRGTGKRVIDVDGETSQTAPFAYGGTHSNGSQPRMNAMLEDPATFTDAECRVITWYLFNSPGHGEPVRRTITEIAQRAAIRDHNPPDIPGTEIKAAPIATTVDPWRTA